LNLPFYIARRYLFAKKSHNAINIISMVSVCGVVVATVAMICILSVFNGYRGLFSKMLSAFDPELKITPAEGKVFDPDSVLNLLGQFGEIELCSNVLQENALIRYGERQEISVVKGVDEAYHKLAMIDTAIIDGRFRLSDSLAEYAVLGIGLAASLGVNASFAYPLEINIPKRDEQINMANPISSLQREYLYIGGVYQINQPVYDEGFMIAPIRLVRSMLNYDREVSALELKLVAGADVDAVKHKIINALGDKYVVKNRYEQQEVSYRMVQIEKRVSYLMLCFVLVLALFNVLGSLAILMTEKEDDVVKLRSLGADDKLINSIFLFEGWMISLFGAIIGIVTGIALCLIQQYFGLIPLGKTAGTFIVNAYPVEIQWIDVLLVAVTVISMGFLAVIYPVHYYGKKRLSKNFVPVIIISLLCVSCNESGKQKDTKEIAVSIEPLRYFADKIADGKYTFYTVMPVGRDPESYDPSPREIMRTGNSKALFYSGRLIAERQVISSLTENNPDIPAFDISAGLYSADGGKTVHGVVGGDPHYWTSFRGAKAISENILKALSAIDSLNKDFYKQNYDLLINKLDSLEAVLHRQLDTLSRRSFMIYHPSLTYFADEFNLKQLSIETGGKEPSAMSLEMLIKEAVNEHVDVIFVQAEYDHSYASQIARETGASIVSINPLDYQWDDQIIMIAKALIEHGYTD